MNKILKNAHNNKKERECAYPLSDQKEKVEKLQDITNDKKRENK